MKNFVEKYKTMVFFLMALLLSWAIWVPMALNRLGIIEFEIPTIIGQSLGGLAPLFSMYLLDKLSEGALGVKSIFDSIRIRGEKIAWLIPAASIVPIITILGNLLSFIFGNDSSLNILASEPLNNFGIGLIAIIPLTFLTYLLSSPLFEEPCWRGFGLINLQKKYGNLIGSLLLGSFWWLWHQPIWVANGFEVNLYSYFLMVSHSFIYDSIYNLSNRNLLSAMFAHSSSIITDLFIFQSNNMYVLILLTIIIVLLRFLELRMNKENIEFNFQLKSN